MWGKVFGSPKVQRGEREMLEMIREKQKHVQSS